MSVINCTPRSIIEEGASMGKFQGSIIKEVKFLGVFKKNLGNFLFKREETMC